MKMKTYIGLIGIAFFASVITSCDKFLDEKPSAKAVIPRKISDLRAMMDNVGHINIYTINVPLEHYSDYVKIDEEDLDKLAYNNREFYTFGQDYDAEPSILGAWSSGFRPIYIANNVFELLSMVSGKDSEEGRQVKGTAHFIRANYMFHLAKVFSPLYVKGDAAANAKLSIPIRLASDVTAVSSRATVQAVYEQMVQDFKAAIALLPDREQYITRPDKASAYACLSRLYLTMQEFESAGKYADSCLKIYDVLMDYNDVDRQAVVPFEIENMETLFLSSGSNMDFLDPADGSYIDPELVASYHDDDLRKEAYYMLDERGRHQFKGNYLGQHYGAPAPDPAVDEMFLTLAECHARAGHTAMAMDRLNHLLKKRWRADKFVPLTAASADEALETILRERKKSLLFRGIRVMDQRRLNLESRFARPVSRVLGTETETKTYVLAPNDLRYVFLIPLNVREITGMPQSER